VVETAVETVIVPGVARAGQSEAFGRVGEFRTRSPVSGKLLLVDFAGWFYTPEPQANRATG
jgi:hypothetical protein